MLSPEQIELLYRNHLLKRFPYPDCYRLTRIVPVRGDDLIPELAYFFAWVAGFASSASVLQLRQPEEIRRAKKTLAKNVFEACPTLDSIRDKVTPDHTPDLCRSIEEVEEMRMALVVFLETIPDEDASLGLT